MTIDSKLKFSTDINGIAAKAHKPANLIIRSFMSRDLTSLVRAFTIYVRPIFTARRNARIASAVLATAIPSVCPSVCLSVRHTPVLCQNDGT